MKRYKKETHINICRNYGKQIKIGLFEFELENANDLYITDLKDFSLITDSDITQYISNSNLINVSIREAKQPKWHYVAHLPPTNTSMVTNNTLRDRVIGGSILAYRGTWCSIEGNQCFYFGYIPTARQEFEYTHRRSCIIDNTDKIVDNIMSTNKQTNSDDDDEESDEYPTMFKEQWIREIYIYGNILPTSNCICGSAECALFVTLLDTSQKAIFCIKNVNLTDIYCIMGNIIDFKKKNIENVDCIVCKQCYRCSRSSEPCRRHKVCKHKLKTTKISLDPAFTVNIFVKPKIKSCIKL